MTDDELAESESLYADAYEHGARAAHADVVAALREALDHLNMVRPSGIHVERAAAVLEGALAGRLGVWTCDWQPDDLNPGPECPYCAGEMCARFDGLNCQHDRQERHG